MSSPENTSPLRDAPLPGELRANAVVEQSSDVTLLLDAAGTITYISPSVTPLLGYTPAELVGHALFLLAHPDDTRVVQSILLDILAIPGDTRRAEYRLRGKDGSYRWLEGSGTNLLQVKGIAAIVGNFRASRERQRREQEQKTRWHLLTESMPQKIFTARPDGMVDYCNEQWLTFTGLSLEQLRNQTLTQCIHPDDREESTRRWQHAIASGEPFEFEHRIHRSDGLYSWHLTRAIPLRDAQKKITLWVGSTTDINEQKQLEVRKNEFINLASHELKTPVTSLQGFTHLLRRRLPADTDSQIHRFLARMDVQLVRLNRLIGDLLDLSRLQMGRLTYQEEMIELDELVRESINLMQEATMTHTIQLMGQTRTTVLGDRERLGQVLFNLLSNAIKYSIGATLVTVTLAMKAENVLISVRDYGIGIAADHHKHIFERFYQVSDPLERTFPGLGVGLYLSSQIVERHQGSLWVESEVGQGATFFVRLPVISQAHLAHQ